MNRDVSTRSSERMQIFLERAQQVILGKSKAVKLALSCVLARGHLLIEDIPGVGKTTVVKTFAKLLGLEKNRVQFTNDMLPADILGISIFDPETQSFAFHKGPIFCQLLVADELNRTTPKTQSALLQAMEEFQITVDGLTLDLPRPFFVIATQNPNEHLGTFPLPESQLDRFLMKIDLGYMDRNEELKILRGTDPMDVLNRLEPVFNADEFCKLQEEVSRVEVQPEILENLMNAISSCRQARLAVSTRASIGLLNAAKAWAFIHHRDFVTPDDIKDLMPVVLTHRNRKHDFEADDTITQQIRDIGSHAL